MLVRSELRKKAELTRHKTDDDPSITMREPKPKGKKTLFNINLCVDTQMDSDLPGIGFRDARSEEARGVIFKRSNTNTPNFK